MDYTRAEAARILTASSHRDMQADDRAYLTRLVTAMTGLAPADEQKSNGTSCDLLRYVAMTYRQCVPIACRYSQGQHSINVADGATGRALMSALGQ